MVHGVEGQHLRAASPQPKVGLSDKLEDGLHFGRSTGLGLGGWGWRDCVVANSVFLMWRNSYSLRIPRNYLEGFFLVRVGGGFLGRDRGADGVRGTGYGGSGRSGFED